MARPSLFYQNFRLDGTGCDSIIARAFLLCGCGGLAVRVRFRAGRVRFRAEQRLIGAAADGFAAALAALISRNRR